MSDHTSGKLTLEFDEHGGYDCMTAAWDILFEGKTSYIESYLATIDCNSQENDPIVEANARRLVACWNACEGLETQDLEKSAQVGPLLSMHADARALAKLVQCYRNAITMPLTDKERALLERWEE